MRTQPGIALIAPSDSQQTRTALMKTWDMPGPVYYRLGKDDRVTVPGLEGRFELGRAQLTSRGSDLLMIAMGSVATEVSSAARALAVHGVACTVMVVASLNPAPNKDLAEVLGRFPLALTVEAHYLVGGLGSLVSEVVAERHLDCRVVRCGVSTTPNGLSGSQSYLRHAHGLSAEALVKTALHQLGRTTKMTARSSRNALRTNLTSSALDYLRR